MDSAYQESLQKINAVLAKHPELQSVAKSLREGADLKNILEFEELDRDILPTIEFEALLVIALFVPISELSDNIAESTNIPKEVAQRIALMVETLIFEPIAKGLYQYDLEMRANEEPSIPDADGTLKEKLELRPESVTGNQSGTEDHGPAPEQPKQAEGLARPLTRDELMRALATKRTMAGDIEATKSSTDTTAQPGVVQGYEAQQKAE